MLEPLYQCQEYVVYVHFVGMVLDHGFQISLLFFLGNVLSESHEKKMLVVFVIACFFAYVPSVGQSIEVRILTWLYLCNSLLFCCLSRSFHICSLSMSSQ